MNLFGLVGMRDSVPALNSFLRWTVGGTWTNGLQDLGRGWIDEFVGSPKRKGL